MVRGFFGNLIFAIIARILCGNHLNMLAFLFSQSDVNKNGYGDQCDGQGKDK